MEKDSTKRKIIKPCYDHISGIVGELLFDFLIKNKWIEKVNNGNEFNITENGWHELELLGIDMGKLKNTKRKVVSPCIERHHGIFIEHTGAHLGYLLSEWTFKKGWIIKNEDNQYLLTDKGLLGFESLGIDTKDIKQDM